MADSIRVEVNTGDGEIVDPGVVTTRSDEREIVVDTTIDGDDLDAIIDTAPMKLTDVTPSQSKGSLLSVKHEEDEEDEEEDRSREKMRRIEAAKKQKKKNQNQ
jgi:hypothetical protein